MKSPLSQRELGALDWFCLRAIAFYQRHISPRKGYRCAHARLHGGGGCSGFVRRAIATRGLRAAMPLAKARFRECKRASQTLRGQVDLDKPASPAGGNRDGRKTKSKGENAGANSGAAWLCFDPSWICCADAAWTGGACEAGACADVGCAEAGCGCLSCW